MSKSHSCKIKISPFLFLMVVLIFVSLDLRGQDDKNEIKEILDISYLEVDLPKDTLRRINFYIPKNTKKPPLLIWIGGGAWSIVNRYMEKGISQRFAEDGIAVAAIGHRLSSCVFIDPKRTTGVKHPAHIQDVATAFSWLKKHADTYGYDPERIFVGGFSSGAHLATLLAMDEKYLAAHGLGIEHVRGIIPVSGGYDISHYHHTILNGDDPHLAEQHVEAVFGNTEEGFTDASPTTYLQNLSVPMQLFSDSQTYQYATIFENLIRDKTEFIDFEMVHVHKYNHSQIWQNLGRKNSIYREMMVKFILSQ